MTQDLTSPPAPEQAVAESDSPMFDGDEINNEDDAEWEFNEDVPATEAAAPEQTPEDVAPPVSDAAGPSAAENDAPIFAESGADIGSGLDLASDDGSESLELDTGDDGHAPASAAAGSSADESSGGTDFGTVDDFSSLMEDDDSEHETEAFDEQDGADSLREQAAEQAGLYAAAGTADALGDPESWEFFDDESPSTPAASSRAPSGGAALGRIGLTSAGAANGLSQPGAGHEVAPDLDGDSRILHVLEATGRLVGWAAVIVMFGFGLVSGLWTTAESFVAGERTAALGSVEAVDMRAQWVDTARAGRLLVVTGGLRNVTRAATTLTGPIEIAFLDRHGVPLAAEPIAAGLALAERQIRELPVEVLGRQRARAAHQLLTASIPVGGQLPFQAVVFEPPSEGLRFVVRQAEGGKLSLPMPSVGRGSDRSVRAEAGAVSDADGLGVEASAEVDDGVGIESDQTRQAPVREGGQPPEPGDEGMYGEDPGLGLQDL